MWTTRHRQRHRAWRSRKRCARCIVTDGVLPMLGVQPALGRLFTRHDDSPGRAETVMLAAGYWQIAGSAATVGDRPARSCSTAGRARSSACCPSVPVPRPEAVARRCRCRLDRSKVLPRQVQLSAAIARLKPGVTLEQATADVARMIPIVARARSRRSPASTRRCSRRREARAEPAAAEGRRGRRHRHRALGADGHDRAWCC